MPRLCLLIISLLLLQSRGLFSQVTEFELLLRPALTSLRGNSPLENNFDNTIKFSGGIGVNYFLKNNFVINAAIIYDSKGGSKEQIVYYNTSPNPGGTIVAEKAVNKADFNYITIPIQWGKRFGKKIKFQFGTGVYASILLNAKTSTETSSYSGSDDVTGNFKTPDLGLSASFASYIPLNEKLKLKVAIDDYFGLLNTSSLPVGGGGSIQHNSLGLAVGLNFALK